MIPFSYHSPVNANVIWNLGMTIQYPQTTVLDCCVHDDSQQHLRSDCDPAIGHQTQNEEFERDKTDHKNVQPKKLASGKRLDIELVNHHP